MSPTETLAQSGHRVLELEQRCVTLRGRLDEERRAVGRLHQDLGLLRAGAFPPGTRPVLAMVLGALILAGGGGALLWRRAEQSSAAWLGGPAAPAVEPQAPHLLITSEPDHASVTLDGAPRGTTPLLLTLPPRAAEHEVRLSTASQLGYARVRIEAQVGAHVHVRLDPHPSAPGGI